MIIFEFQKLLTDDLKGTEPQRETFLCVFDSLSLCVKTHLRPREVVAVIISREVREVREVFILLSLLGDLEFWRFGVLESSFNTEAERHRDE